MGGVTINTAAAATTTTTVQHAAAIGNAPDPDCTAGADAAHATSRPEVGYRSKRSTEARTSASPASLSWSLTGRQYLEAQSERVAAEARVVASEARGPELRARMGLADLAEYEVAQRVAELTAQRERMEAAP
jgi:hypothetical protein